MVDRQLQIIHESINIFLDNYHQRVTNAVEQAYNEVFNNNEMKDKNGNEVVIGSKISVDPEKQPIFEVKEFKQGAVLVTCFDDKGENFYFATDTLLIPNGGMSKYVIVPDEKSKGTGSPEAIS